MKKNGSESGDLGKLFLRCLDPEQEAYLQEIQDQIDVGLLTRDDKGNIYPTEQQEMYDSLGLRIRAINTIFRDLTDIIVAHQADDPYATVVNSILGRGVKVHGKVYGTVIDDNVSIATGAEVYYATYVGKGVEMGERARIGAGYRVMRPLTEEEFREHQVVTKTEKSDEF